MKKLIANREIEVNEEGYLVDFQQWDKEICECIADECNVVMSEKHWEVVEYLQDKHKSEEPLSIRGIKRSGVINIKEFYNLFPGGPLKVSTKIAGIPKPKSCI
ncbi:MAG: TusE/DsrC/DsvC family sulfur relay protein [Bacteroidia bacterium]|nr:TusE/DsrC/DsvC family sulfur relay protein [Bacteroidia bacterium]NND26686.1 TusE/DsrC/DsvC family sulfur relay protein [Flavobacteriaceae bacterium]MBT8277931.1 TusE/DsrC/DsvC family sulfur relay protein [Bacteroidia bacterium]NNK59148.1 TusE/DsrC/DsvC family sulfur relay protein [Flavobacteriaceae bacterium]NNL32209.1 TusE/DsrC/DsvC family sulfur relay protein [Flavobacteriaceae bacterium]